MLSDLPSGKCLFVYWVAWIWGKDGMGNFFLLTFFNEICHTVTLKEVTPLSLISLALTKPV